MPSCRAAQVAFSLVALAMAPQAVLAGSYVGVSAEAFSGVGTFDRRSDGFGLHVGMSARPWLAFEAGWLEQRGESDFGNVEIDVPQDYRWRALHLGPHLSWSPAPRWYLGAGLEAAYVSADRERAIIGGSPTQPPHILEVHALETDTWGVLSTLRVAYELTPSQRLSLDYRRLDARLRDECTALIGTFDCGYRAARSADGFAVAWSYRFD